VDTSRTTYDTSTDSTNGTSPEYSTIYIATTTWSKPTISFGSIPSFSYVLILVGIES
jgi:hypothetical protein